MAKRFRSSDVLKYPTFYYLPYQLLDGDVLTEREQREELSRLLSIARKRQRRLQQSEFSDSYNARVHLPSMKELRSSRDVSRALADVALFIRARTGSVTGAREYRAEVVETLQTTFEGVAEVDFTDPGFNWKMFGQYMRDMKRAGKANEGADSERAVRMFFIGRKVGLTAKGLRENYDAFLQRQDELAALAANNPYGRTNISGANMLARLDAIREAKGL